jgi:hypothetical protein
VHSRFGSEFCYECDDKGFGSGCDQLIFFSIITVDWNASEEMKFDFYGFFRAKYVASVARIATVGS